LSASSAHKDKAQVVEVVEPIGGDWTMVHESMKHEKKDASTFVFKPTVPANGSKISFACA
jgi:hypothetical protein